MILGLPKALLESVQGHNYFQCNTKVLFVRITLVSVHWHFQELS